MSDLIQTPEQLKEWFFSWHKHFDKYNKMLSGVNVGSKVRRDVMCGENQPSIIIDGKVFKIEFESLGGGVFRAFVDAY